jgi:hypothetical protein
MLLPWVLEEMKTADLKDKRLDARLREVLSQLGAHPVASIPAACGGPAEMTAAYRFFDNEKVTFDSVLQPHQAATRKRLDTQDIAVLVQDTTEMDLTRPGEQVAGAGPLDGSARYGLLLHLLTAFTPDGTPLGTLAAHTWVRDEQAVRTASLSRAQRAAMPLAEKESYRWIETLQQAQTLAADMPRTRLICVADSEADIYELLVAGQTEPRSVEWIVRACQNRALVSATQDAACAREQALAQEVLFRQSITVRGRQSKVSCESRGRRQPRESRQAGGRGASGACDTTPPVEARSEVASDQSAGGRRSRGRAATGRRTGGMASVDEPSGRRCRAGPTGHPILLHPLDDRDLVPHAEAGMPSGSASLRAHRPAAPLRGPVFDRGLADPVRLPLEPQPARRQLRGRVRALRMEGRLSGGSRREPAERTSTAE